MLFGIRLHSGLFYSYPTLSCWFNFLDMKAVRELYNRRQEEKLGGEDIFYILPLFLGSTTIQSVRKFFQNTSEMVASPSQGVKNVLVVLGYIYPNVVGWLDFMAYQPLWVI